MDNVYEMLPLRFTEFCSDLRSQLDFVGLNGAASQQVNKNDSRRTDSFTVRFAKRILKRIDSSELFDSSNDSSWYMSTYLHVRLRLCHITSWKVKQQDVRCLNTRRKREKRTFLRYKSVEVCQVHPSSAYKLRFAFIPDGFDVIMLVRVVTSC